VGLGLGDQAVSEVAIFELESRAQVVSEVVLGACCRGTNRVEGVEVRWSATVRGSECPNYVCLLGIKSLSG